MVSSILASTSVILILGFMNFFTQLAASTRQNYDNPTNDNLFGFVLDNFFGLKVVALILLNVTSFFCFTQAMRFYNHGTMLITICVPQDYVICENTASSTSTVIDVEQTCTQAPTILRLSRNSNFISRVLNTAEFYHAAGLRCYYFNFLVIAYLWGILPLFIADGGVFRGITRFSSLCGSSGFPRVGSVSSADSVCPVGTIVYVGVACGINNLTRRRISGSDSCLGSISTRIHIRNQSSSSDNPKNTRTIANGIKEQETGVAKETGTAKQQENTKENIYTLPNVITMARIGAAPVIGACITAHNYPVALGLLGVAALSDVADGFIARRFNMTSHFGTVLDPAADKILMTVLTVSLCHAGLLSFPLASLIIARDIGLILGTMVVRYTSLPPPKTWSRYWDVSLPSADVSPPLISKLNTFLQLALMYLSLAAPVYGVPIDHVGLEALRWTVGGTTIASAASYWFGNNVKVLQNH
ncbi:hypothetical protein HK100_004062 [Physocladia obscura]|uniref:Cardiolipin synthase n=1 Tax=Physocladia obscura TaxID=109957 RepID=A0AAD5XJM4_9FUNG|nr:hypothetical protein HK100_004062 [Physocladia obscura]